MCSFYKYLLCLYIFDTIHLLFFLFFLFFFQFRTGMQNFISEPISKFIVNLLQCLKEVFNSIDDICISISLRKAFRIVINFYIEFSERTLCTNTM